MPAFHYTVIHFVGIGAIDKTSQYQLTRFIWGRIVLVFKDYLIKKTSIN